MFAPGASCKGNVSSIHANIVIVFRSSTCLKKISINNTFSRSQVKGQRHRLTGCHWHLNGRNSINLWIIEMKQQLKCKKCSYVATATNIRFHFQFPRPPGAAFGGGWLLNRKFKFGCRIICNIANYVECNYFLDDDGIDNVTLRLWKFSEFGSRHIVGVAGDDIMYHILVTIYHFILIWST